MSSFFIPLIFFREITILLRKGIVIPIGITIPQESTPSK